MTREPVDSNSVQEESKYELATGLNVADILTLPNPERRVVSWLVRQQEASLTEIATHIDLPEIETQALLNDLIEQGFVSEVGLGAPPRYQVRFARKRERHFPEQLHQALAPAKPLTVVLSPSGSQGIAAGSTFELNVTIFNKGSQSALIDIFIQEIAQVLYQWCSSPYEHLALDPGQNGDVSFQFQVPPETLPDTYEYFLVVDAPRHYPEDTPIRYSQNLQVLPPVDAAVRASDPTFTLQPITTSATPAILDPTEPLQFQVQIHNRSDRVDRFRLSCTDLPLHWFSVHYPEGLEELGTITGADSLELNPGSRDEVSLTITPPVGSLAGSYFPTVRVYSANNPDLMLLNAIYLKVLPTYELTVELRTLRGRVRRRAGQFAIHLSNQGNIGQAVALRVRDQDEEAEFCTYTLDRSQVEILPQTETSVELQVKPKKWWRRPFFGPGLPLTFIVELEETQQLPLETPSTVGTLIWLSRPWWQLLGLILTIVGAIAAILLLVWLIFFRPPTPPILQEFYSEASSYQEGESGFIRLSWQIRHPGTLGTVTIVGKSPDDTIVSQPVSYDFSQGKVPAELEQFCSLQRVRLICRNVQTDARKAGDYIFTMTLFAQGKDDTVIDSLNTSTIQIEPIALPKIIEFRSPVAAYQAASSESKSPTQNGIRLNWKIIHPGQIQQLQLIGRAPDGSVNSELKRYDFSQGIPKPLQKFCQVKGGLICQNVPTGARKAGDYIFELAIVAKGGEGEPVAAQKTDTIKVEPQRTSIQILSFQVNGKPALPKYIFAIDPNTPSPTLVLSWQIKGNEQTKVELLPAPGTVTLKGEVPYPIAQKPGSETLTLQVTSPTGDQIARSVTIETFDPNTVDPATAAAEAAAAAAAAAANADNAEDNSAGEGDSAAPAPDLDAPAPSDPDSLSPAELPPQFD